MHLLLVLYNTSKHYCQTSLTCLPVSVQLPHLQQHEVQAAAGVVSQPEPAEALKVLLFVEVIAGHGSVLL